MSDTNKEQDLFDDVSGLLKEKLPVAGRWTHHSGLFFDSESELLSLRSVDYIDHSARSVDNQSVPINGWHIWNFGDHVINLSDSQWEPNHFYLLTVGYETRYLLATCGYARLLNALADKIVSGQIRDYNSSDVFGLDSLEKGSNELTDKEFKATDNQRELLSKLKAEIPGWLPLKAARKAYGLIVESRLGEDVVLEQTCNGLPEHVVAVLKKYQQLYVEIAKKDGKNNDGQSLGKLKAWSDLLDEWGYSEQLDIVRKSVNESYLEWDGRMWTH